MNEKERVIHNYREYVVPCYTKSGIVFQKGRGSYLWDTEGRRYLDFFPGWAVCGLGHCPPNVTEAIRSQAGLMMHLPNNHYHPWQGDLARRLAEISFNSKSFFCNSGAEANEAAIKLARLYGAPTGRYKIISMEDSFHGRTMATVTMTGQPKYNEVFKPLPEGFQYVPFNDLERLKQAVDAKTIAVILEPIQGEGGVNVVDRDYLAGVKALAEEKDLLLIFDEVQTGFGRTGRMFAYQHFGVEPHIMTIAKTMGGGFPVGAMLARPAIADLMVPGTHAATFGGNPLACASCLAVIETIEKEGLVGNAERMGVYMREKLSVLSSRYESIKEIKGLGLMIGLEISGDCQGIVGACSDAGLLVNCTHGNILRLMPALTVQQAEVDEAVNILDGVLCRFSC